MITFLQMLLVVAWGALLHLTYWPTSTLPTKIRNLLRNTIGAVGTFPAVLMFWITLRPTGTARDHEAERRLTISYALGYLCVGCGVALAYIADGYLDWRHTDDE